MRQASKIVAKDSCNFALNRGNSNETNIKITPEIAELFGVVPNSGESFDVSFTIEKGDFLRSFCQIMGALPLYNNKGQLIHFSELLFQNKSKAIFDFFGDDSKKEIRAKLTRPEGHPICLNFGANNFCIRDYLVESRSLLTFTESDGRVKLNIKYDDNDDAILEESVEEKPEQEELQQIFYGAPGTGKSHEIKGKTAIAENEDRVIRTTFHPDSDYSTFVGAYKPTSVEVPVMAIFGTKAVPAENPDGTQRKEKKIVYEFVPQAFLKAYTGAWKNLGKPFYLIIEEINRGNCAQIFGDLFQLLDRNDEGESEYSISPDEDIQKFLLTNSKYGFADLTEEQKASIPEEIRSGQKLILPKNLRIWATMNTSDQSLFPIDSAFKRRWDWKYIPIVNAAKGWKIEVNGKQYDWWAFLEKVNDKIYSTTKSEDKKMGYFFCKPHNGIIDAETFVGKVIFYIWNDVFKDFVDEAGDLFKDADNSQLSFNKFYTGKGSESTGIAKDKVELFLKNLKLDAEQNSTEDLPVLDEDGNDTTSSDGRNYDYTKYSINGQGSYPKGRVAQEAIRIFVNAHPEMTGEDVVQAWSQLNVKVPNLVETRQMFESRTASSSDPGLSNRFKTVQMSNGDILYVSNQYNVERINELISKVNAQPWGIRIESI